MERWVQTWGQAHTALSAFSFRDGCRTFRLLINTAVGGKRVRVRLSNVHGTAPVTLGGVCVARCDENGVLCGDSVDLDAPQRLGAGESAVTGSGKLDLQPGDWFCVSLCVQSGELQSGNLENTARCLVLSGDSRHAIYPTPTTRLKETVRKGACRQLRMQLKPPVPLFETVEVLNVSGASAIAVFGDSLSQQGFWTQPFERRIRARFPGRFSVINRGINGNRVLRDTSPVFPLHGFYGVRGVNRLQRDVLQYSDVSHAILSLGVNDLVHYASISGKPQEKPDVDVLCEAIFSLSDRMRETGIRVMGCTLVNFRDCIDATDEKADLCDQVNAVLRQNESRFDALFDLNAVVADPARPQHTRLDYLGKDKMHFNILGGAAVADAIDLGFFRL